MATPVNHKAVNYYKCLDFHGVATKATTLSQVLFDQQSALCTWASCTACVIIERLGSAILLWCGAHCQANWQASKTAASHTFGQFANVACCKTGRGMLYWSKACHWLRSILLCSPKGHLIVSSTYMAEAVEHSAARKYATHPFAVWACQSCSTVASCVLHHAHMTLT